MKAINSVLCMLLFVACASGKENSYTGSTPASPVVRAFLGIPLIDSIDFIRWNLTLNDKHYTLNCNYGIGKPNTNGFINGGKRIELSGLVNKEQYYTQLQNGNKRLKIIVLNANLLHILDEDNNLLVGNGGWSYTLNNIRPLTTNQVSMNARQTAFKDSLAFEGRTPCGVPGIIPPGVECYKLKWYIVLYADAVKNEEGRYKVYGTNWRKQGGKTGKWKMIKAKDGRIIYELEDENKKVLLYLLKLDENILVFTDAEQNLLVGDEDFSFTMNRIVRR